MLIEHRTYTLRPGQFQAFVDMQVERGFDSVRSTMDRLMGYFGVIAGPEDEIIHLYRYDSYADWFDRLHGYYATPTSKEYLRRVRTLMTAQENKFLAPAPIADFTPNWGNGRDWLPGGALIEDLKKNPDILVEETTLVMIPGLIDDYWEALREHASRADGGKDHLVGVFFCLAGRLHQIVTYRLYETLEVRAEHKMKLSADKSWRSYQELVQKRVSSQNVKLMRPVSVKEMSPLFIAQG